MSEQKEVLREIARVISGDGPFRIDEWFTEDFRLVEPTKPNWPRGHEGASKLLALFRTLTPPVQFVALDMVEEADRVAVRWQLSATYQGDPLSLASMAIYRFKDGRIAEDWGIPKLTSELVAPGVVFLASSACTISAAVLNAAGGRFSAAWWGRTDEFDLGPTAASPEDIAACWQQIAGSTRSFS